MHSENAADVAALHPSLAVGIVAGTRVRLSALEAQLSRPGVSIVGLARTAAEAEELVTQHAPSAVLLDLDLAAGGLDVVERIMATRPTPIVVCGAAGERPEVALAAGAVDVVGALDYAPGSPEYVEALVRHLRIASRVRVITHPRARLRPPRYSTRTLPYGRVNGAPNKRPHVVAIGASTGGPPALATILAELPADLDAVVLVVQHMAEGFVEGLARWLDELCPLDVRIACDGERLLAGTVRIAPAMRNLTIGSNLRVELHPPMPGQFHLPGIDPTFTSVAACAPRGSVGVLLTGMGRDGAAGLSAMRSAGAFTIGQDESTSVVWGMPAAAQALDAVDVELELADIASAITDAVRRGVAVAGEAL